MFRLRLIAPLNYPREEALFNFVINILWVLKNKKFPSRLGTNISLRSKTLIAQLRTNSHELCCETGGWKRPNEAWEEMVCMFCTSRKVETEKHFILECEAFKDTRDNYVSILTESSWNNVFSSEGTVEKLGELIVKLNRKRVELQKSMCEAVCPIGYC